VKNVTECYLLFALDSRNSIALVMKSKLSTSIKNSIEMLEKVKTGTKVVAVFSKLKVFCLLIVYVQILLLLLRSKKRYAIPENS